MAAIKIQDNPIFLLFLIRTGTPLLLPLLILLLCQITFSIHNITRNLLILIKMVFKGFRTEGRIIRMIKKLVSNETNLFNWSVSHIFNSETRFASRNNFTQSRNTIRSAPEARNALRSAPIAKYVANCNCTHTEPI